MSRRQTIHHYIYAVLLCLLCMSMTTSVYVTNLVYCLLAVNWVVSWDWREKFSGFKKQYLLQAFLAFFLVHLLWMAGSENLSYGLFDIQKKLPLLALPLVILTTPQLTRRQALNVLIAYCGTVVVVTFIGIVRYLTIPDLPYREIVPYISHIRFGLNICMCIALLAYLATRVRKTWLTIVVALVTLWLLSFLLLLQAYTAFVILFITSWVIVVCYGNRMKDGVRKGLLITLTSVSLLLVMTVGYFAYGYYHLQPLSVQPLKSTTVNGNPYCHGQDGMIENGNYISRYVCDEELYAQWSQVSSKSLDSVTDAGYTLYPALVRYLNGKGLTKDSVGVSRLSPADVEAVEKSIANPVYLHHGSLRKMAYVMFYEFESYRCLRSVKNFTMLQRFELWKTGCQVFAQHPLWGVGTGDVVDQCHAQLEANNSPLAGTSKHTHNQYLTLLATFGILGFGIILLFFIRAIRKNQMSASVLFTVHLCITLISFVSEDTLETLAGAVFVALFICLLAPRKAGEVHPYRH